jgi:hypothetical protein
MKKILMIFLISVIPVSGIRADDFTKAGTAGAQFLKIGVGARYHGFGEAAVACADDIYSLYWNPAGLTSIASSELAFTHIDYVTDISLNYVAYARRFPQIGVFGTAVTVLSMSDQEITTIEEPDGTGDFYSVSSWAFQLSYARDLTASFSFGGTVKFIGEKIHRENAYGFAFDFGTMLYTGVKSLRLGMNISNMGPEMKFDGPDLDVAYEPDPSNPNQDPFNSRLKVDPYDLPLIFRVGLACDFQLNENSKLLVSVEAKHPNDNVQQGSLGAEYGWKDRYFLRAGYKLNYEEEGLGLGGGIEAPLTDKTDLILDYAWVDFGRFSSVHRFSAALRF